MTEQRWTDIDGHDWPVTGYWCVECGLPLATWLVDNGETTHPNCEEVPS